MKIKDNCKIRNIAGEQVVILQGEDGSDLTRIISLNSTSVLLWNEFQSKDFTIEEAAQFLCSRFKVTMETALADVSAWANKLIDCKVIES